MHVLLRLACGFQRYEPFVGRHIAEAMRRSSLKEPTKYQRCTQSFDLLIEKYPSSAAQSKCKMIYEVSCLGESLEKYETPLSKLIIEGTIQDKSALDQVVKWLSREVKYHVEIDEEHIRRKLEEKSKQMMGLEREIEELARTDQENISKINVNSKCKYLRDKFTTIDSKDIYVRVTSALSRLIPLCATQSTVCSLQTNHFWDKITKIKPRILTEECNTKEQHLEHLRVTEGKLRFRFPPEPNGYLHIGHVKSIRINFETAKRSGGTCYLRYDDTNPAKESYEYIKQIEENVKWLGYTPDKITFASDHFQQMIDLARQLIKTGNAYVCELPKADLEIQRKQQRASPFRDRPIEESLRYFPKLEPHQTLRLKGDPQASNPTLRDPIIYRRKSEPHPRTGSKFSVYPIYDFAHCICDSIEHIDYSLCSLEFEVRRELYYKILHLLGMYKPNVWQYSRLNVEGNALSKRIIKKMVDGQEVDGWGDPRLLTIKGLKNRGYTPEVLFAFIDQVNASRTGNENIVQYSLLQKELKSKLLSIAAKTMAVLQPHLISIWGTEERIAEMEMLPGKKRKMRVSAGVYIQKKDAERLIEGGTVILKYSGAYRVRDGGLQRIGDSLSERKRDKGIRIIHWVCADECLVFPVATYEKLLLLDGSVNPASKRIFTEARLPKDIFQHGAEYWQFQRVGFFWLWREAMICCVQL